MYISCWLIVTSQQFFLAHEDEPTKKTRNDEIKISDFLSYFFKKSFDFASTYILMGKP
jgi:hypothetical protein